MSKQVKKVSSVQKKSSESHLSFGRFIPEKYQTPALLALDHNPDRDLFLAGHVWR